MAKKVETSNLEVFENPEALEEKLSEATDFITKNRNVVFGIAGAIVALVVGFLGYNWYKGSQDEEGQKAMYTAVYDFEADSLDKALKGRPGGMGLLAIADEFGSSAAGNLAHYYAGAALMKQGKFDQAIEQLKDFSSSDLLVQARAYALIGDAYMEKNAAEDAISYYEKAVSQKVNKYFTPGYLMKLAIAQEKAKQNTKAIDTYAKIVNDYPQSSETANAKKYKSMLEAAE